MSSTDYGVRVLFLMRWHSVIGQVGGGSSNGKRMTGSGRRFSFFTGMTDSS